MSRPVGYLNFGDAMKAPVKAGRESRMKEPYKKGRANHLDPESCAEAGNRVGEAWTGAHLAALLDVH